MENEIAKDTAAGEVYFKVGHKKTSIQINGTLETGEEITILCVGQGEETPARDDDGVVVITSDSPNPFGIYSAGNLKAEKPITANAVGVQVVEERN